MQWSALLQEEGNISYHSICPRKSSARKKEDQYRYGSIQHAAAFTGHKHTYNQIVHNLNTEIEAPSVCVSFILFFYSQMAL